MLLILQKDQEEYAKEHKECYDEYKKRYLHLSRCADVIELKKDLKEVYQVNKPFFDTKRNELLGHCWKLLKDENVK